jgi:hypothetical protein
MDDASKAAAGGMPGNQPLDPIKAALDAAARAACQERCAFMGEPPCWQVSGDWPNPECAEPGCGATSAVAVAAFLRALPNNGMFAWHMRNRDHGAWQPAPEMLGDLAAAVERAAQEAPHG